MKSKTVSARELEPGKYLKIAYNSQEAVILENQRIRDEEHLEQLREKGLDRAVVLPELNETPQVPEKRTGAVERINPANDFEGRPSEQEAPPVETVQKELEEAKTDVERMETLGDRTLTKVKDVLGGIQRKENVDPDELEPYSEMLTDEINKNPSLAVMLTTLEQAEHTIFQHSINVAVHTIHWGKYRGYTYDELKLIGKAGLLHDVGKMEMNDILRKEGALTDEEYEIVQKHPTKGGIILDQLGCSPPIPRVAREHHERPKGVGYPVGKEIDELHPYSRMVSIIDVYDAIVSNRVYSTSKHPLKALQEMKEEFGHDETSQALFREFIQFNGYFPPGTGIVLNNGFRGVVVEPNVDAPKSPQVSLIENEEGISLDSPISVDLEAISNRKRIINGELFDHRTKIASVFSVDKLDRQKTCLMKKILGEAGESEE